MRERHQAPLGYVEAPRNPLIPIVYPSLEILNWIGRCDRTGGKRDRFSYHDSQASENIQIEGAHLEQPSIYPQQYDS